MANKFEIASFNLFNFAKKFWDMFGDPTPKDVEIPQKDENGDIVVYTSPNRAKIFSEKTKLIVAFMSAPYSFNSYFKNNWKFAHLFLESDRIPPETENEYFEFVKDGEYFIGIKIKKTGIYEARYLQRGNNDSGYGGVGIDGSRSILEDRYGNNAGPWIHSHSVGANNFTESFYFGRLDTDEVLTAGSAFSDKLMWGGDAFLGQVYLRLVKEL